MVWNQKQISANYFPNICPEVKLNWNFDLLHQVNSKFYCNSLIEWSFALWIDIPSSAFQNIYVSQTAQKIALLKRALEKHSGAMVMSPTILKILVKRLSLTKRLHLGLKEITCLTQALLPQMVSGGTITEHCDMWIKTTWKKISFIWKTVCKRLVIILVIIKSTNMVWKHQNTVALVPSLNNFRKLEAEQPESHNIL